MYTEENERGRFPLRDILLKAIIVLIFIILIIFLITKLTTPNNKSNTTSNNSNTDKVFSENLKKMESAALSYYTKDKLPQAVGDVSELTLREMINSNLLEAFTDSSGNACNVDKSYIRLTKNDNDYTLRVNLECGKTKDYSLMKVGEYDYCEDDICKKDSSKGNSEKKKEEKEEVTDEVEITETSDTTIASNNSTSSANNTINSNQANNNYYNYNKQPTNTNQTSIMYEYRKIINPILSSWSAWSSWDYNNERYSAIKCGSNDTSCLKEIQLYSRKEAIGTKDGKVVYGIVHYYSYRTRTLISNGYTDIKWSSYNDSNLLNQGYIYTGNTK